MSGNGTIRPNERFNAELLTRLDGADGERDGVVDLGNAEVQAELEQAGVGADELEVLDAWDGNERDSHGRLHLDRVRTSSGTVTAGPDGALQQAAQPPRQRGQRTFFENRVDGEARLHAYAAILQAARPRVEAELAGAVGEAGNWRDMTRGQYEARFTSWHRGSRTPFRADIEGLAGLRERAALMQPPNQELIAAADAYTALLQHFNGALASRDPARTQELETAYLLLANARRAVAQLPPEQYRELRSELGQGLSDFNQMLDAFPAVSRLAQQHSAEMGETATADSQLGPYVVKTGFRLAERQRAAGEGEVATVEDTIASYYRDTSAWRGRFSAMAGVRERMGEFSSEADYIAAMRGVAGESGAHWQAAAEDVARAQWRAGTAETHLDEAASALSTGETEVREATTHLTSGQDHQQTAEEAERRAIAALERGDTDVARREAEAVTTELDRVDAELQAARRRLQVAEGSSTVAGEHLDDAGTDLGLARDARDRVEAGSYRRAFRGNLAQVTAEIAGLERRHGELTRRREGLDQRIASTRGGVDALQGQADTDRTSTGGLMSDVDRLDAEAAERAYEQALQGMHRDGTLVINEDGLAALIGAAADENGEHARVDFRIGGGVTAQGSIGLVGGRAWVQGLVSSGVSVRRGDLDSVEVGIDIQAMLNAGVEAEFLFGLVGTGAEVTVSGGGRLAYRFENERDAARFLMQRVYGPIMQGVRDDLPEGARDDFDGIVQMGPIPTGGPAGRVVQIREGRVGVEGAGRVRGGIPGVASASLRAGGGYEWASQGFYDATNGRHISDGRVGTAHAFFEANTAVGDDAVSIRGQINWQSIEGDPNPYNNGEFREWTFQVSMSGRAASAVAARGGPAIAQIAGEMLGVQGSPPFTDDQITAAGVSRQMLETVAGGVETALLRAGTGSVSFNVTVFEEDVADQAAGQDADYEVMYTRVGMNYSTFAGAGSGGLREGGGALGTHVTAGVGYERREVLFEIVGPPLDGVDGGRSRAREDYVMQNFGTLEGQQIRGRTVPGNVRAQGWAGQHRGAVLATFLSPDYEDNIPAGGQVEVAGETWDAARIRALREELRGSTATLMPRERFNTMVNVMWALEQQANVR